jgi:hypothetical protein
MKGSIRSIPLVLTSTRRGFHQELEKLAETWGAKYLFRSIRYEKLPDSSAPDIESQLTDIYIRLNRIFSVDTRSLEWLRELKVFRGNSKILRFSLEGQGGVISLPAVVPTNRGNTALILSEESDIGSSTTNAIASWAVGLGFPADRQTELSNMIQTFLTDLEYQDAQATQIPGYYETLGQLSSIYAGCEICGSCTPKDEITGETSESIKSIVSDRGGFLKGKLSEYEIGNSLYLCPRHAILMTRGLVRLDFLEQIDGNRRKVVDAIQKAVVAFKNNPTLRQIPIQVYEGNFLEERKTGWQTRQLRLETKHATALFNNLLKHIG